MPKVNRDFNKSIIAAANSPNGNGCRLPQQPTRTLKIVKQPVLPDLTTEPDLVAAIERDLSGLGIAGEEDNLLGLYVVGISRKLTEPLSALVMGDSSTGKSRLIAAAASLMPTSEVLYGTRITPQALYHLEEPIAHKLVVGGERSHVQDDAFAESTAALRQLRSEGKITKQITERNGNEFVTREVTVEGPIAFVESTTLEKSQVFAEDLNRGLILKTDGSEDQNRKAMKEMAKRCSVNKEESADKEAIKARHHKFQESLVAYDVAIPFIDKLAESIPATTPQCRRVFGQVMAMIETITFLHQHMRQKIDRRLVATVDDYAIGRRLLLKSLKESIGLNNHENETFVSLTNAFKVGQVFTTTAAESVRKESRPTVIKHLNKLRGFGLIGLVNDSKGRIPATWRLSGMSIDDLILPPADLLR